MFLSVLNPYLNSERGLISALIESWANASQEIKMNEKAIHFCQLIFMLLDGDYGIKLVYSILNVT